jgi:PPP family 3-phenylpropionic acid transporter
MSETNKEPFPIRLFLIYIIFYSGQSIYTTYLNLYLHERGLSQSQIGLIVSVSTGFILAAQLFWGVQSDRAKTKNNVLLLLYAGSGLAALLFYLGGGFWFLLGAVTLFAVFFNPIMPLQDNIMLESFESSRWDYGQVRMGGTIGYCVTVLVIGFVLQNHYGNIFWMVCLAMACCILVSRRLRKVQGYRGSLQKTPYRELLKNKTLLGMIIFNLTFALGLNFFYSFYPIYYTSIGGNSSLIGALMFACAVAEIPVLLVVNRFVARFGVGKILILAGIATSIRWFLLYMLRNPYLIIAANLLHGIGYTGFSYCIITYINRTVPKDLRATSQSGNALISSVFTRIIFGYIGGLASERFGVQYMILLAGIIMAVSTVVFALWVRNKNTIMQFRDAAGEAINHAAKETNQ